MTSFTVLKKLGIPVEGSQYESSFNQSVGGFLIRLLTDKCNRVHSPPLVENPPTGGFKKNKRFKDQTPNRIMQKLSAPRMKAGLKFSAEIHL